MNYLDFEVEIGPGSGREYPVTVLRSPAGEAREVMTFPFDKLALEYRLKDLQIALLRSGGTRRLALSSEEETVQGFGQVMFNALLTGEVRSRYDMSQERAKAQGYGLRLKLRIQSPELAALPWEFLYDPREAEYVSLSVKTPVVRYLELPQPTQPLTITLPLQILGMIASPSDLHPLDVRREKQRVEQATKYLLASGLLNLTWLEGQTWRDLQRAMRGGPWHVFHFIGHGGFDKSADEGLLVLANEEGESYRLGATQLGRLLADHDTLRLALLNACEGARGSGHDIFSSTAAILVRRGIPAVLAMQYEITDSAAIEFARSFYEAVADGLPVDAAVAEARKAIDLAVSNTMEWGTPVLYMRSPDGVLFNIQGQVERLAEERAAAERLAREKAELERLAQKRAEQERLAREKAEAERLAAQKAEAESIAREKAEAERLEALKAEEERITHEKAEQERLSREKEEAERLAAQKAESERLALERAEHERQAREKAEADRLAALRVEEERIAHEKAEQERLAREKAETDRIALQKAEEEQLARDAEQAEVERRAKEEANRIAAQKAETERLTRIPAKEEGRAGETELEAQARHWAARAVALTKIIWRPVLLTAAGWTLGYLLILPAIEQLSTSRFWWAAGLIGGLVTGLALLWTAPSFGEKNWYVVFGFAITGSLTSGISDAIGWALTEATDYASVGDLGLTWGNLMGWLIGWAMFGAGAGAILSKFWHLSRNRSLIFGSGWAIAGVIGWVIPEAIAPVIKAIGAAIPLDTDLVILVTSVTLALAIAGVVGGGVMFWQLHKATRSEEDRAAWGEKRTDLSTLLAGRALVPRKMTWFPLLLAIIGWGIGSAISVRVAENSGLPAAWRTFGAIGGFVSGLILPLAGRSTQQRLLYAGGWAISGAIGGAIAGALGAALTEATGYATVGIVEWEIGVLFGWLVGWAIFGAVLGLTIPRKHTLVVGGGWVAAGIIGWLIPQALAVAGWYLEYPAEWIVTLVSAGVLGSGVMFWQLGRARPQS